jgi:RNA polymerase sigma factor (sigma-70 family)
VQHLSPLGVNLVDFWNVTMRQHPPLSRAEEVALLARVAKGNKAAKERVLKHNVRIVVMYAMKYHRYVHDTVELDDLIQEGVCGLSTAIDKFDLDKGNRFTTYASWWIKAHILRVLKKAKEIPSAAFSIDAELPLSGEGKQPYHERLHDPEAQITDDELDRRMASHTVGRTLLKFKGKVGPVGWDIIQNRFLDDNLTLDRIGVKHGVSRERVRQIEKSVRTLLKTHLAAAAES